MRYMDYGTEFPKMPKSITSSRCKWCNRDHPVLEVCMSNPSYVLPIDLPSDAEEYSPLIVVDTTKDGDYTCKVSYQVRNGSVLVSNIEYV